MARKANRLVQLLLAAACVAGFGVTVPSIAAVDMHGQPPLQQWVPAGQPRVVLLCLHGLGLHAGSFADFGQRMVRDGVAVYAIDVRGFGEWWLRNESKVDFDATMHDIGVTRDAIAKEYPGVPIFIVGESMGGAIALQAASKYPDKFDGLICAVPSGDRFGDLNVDLHLGLKVLTKGFDERFNVGDAVIKHATTKHDQKNAPLDAKSEAHRAQWANDPRGRKQYSVGELLAFQNFMNKNRAAAEALKSMPVLFVQGAHDALVRPSGTWDVWGYLATPNRDKVISESAEHLIFENGQFSGNDIKFVDNWIGRVTAKAPSVVPPVGKPSVTEGVAMADPAMSAPSIIKSVSNLAYWIELKRDGKTFRCNNKTEFRSGDEIRFHVRAGVDGYAYIVLKQGSGGARAVLFPEPRTGTDNAVAAGTDCAIPTKTYLRFDDKPGMEKLSLVFSKRPIEGGGGDDGILTAYVSPDKSGSKDLVPTRMQLSWDDVAPVQLSNIESAVTLAATNSSLVKVSSPDDTMAVDVALEHK